MNEILKKITNNLDAEINQLNNESDNLHTLFEKMDEVISNMDSSIQSVLNDVKYTLSTNNGAPITSDNHLSINLKETIAIKENTIGEYENKIDILNAAIKNKVQKIEFTLDTLSDVLPADIVKTYNAKIAFIISSLQD